ncbi:hypothetical protein T484DRAFT_1799213, partial [Baffinella frigidus]
MEEDGEDAGGGALDTATFNDVQDRLIGSPGASATASRRTSLESSRASGRRSSVLSRAEQRSRRASSTRPGQHTALRSSMKDLTLSEASLAPGIESIKPGNPLDDWGKFSAGTGTECDACLATHSFVWHTIDDKATCNSCWLDRNVDLCPFCGSRDIIKDRAVLKDCTCCNRSFHVACELQFRTKPHAKGVCVVCEMQARISSSDFSKGQSSAAHRDLMLKHLPTILNHHIFEFPQFFSVDS